MRAFPPPPTEIAAPPYRGCVIELRADSAVRNAACSQVRNALPQTSDGSAKSLHNMRSAFSFGVQPGVSYRRQHSSFQFVSRSRGTEFDAFPEKGWDKVMDLNVKSPFFLTQALAESLRNAASKEKPANVINLFLAGQQGRAHPPDAPNGRPADPRQHRRERDRSGRVRHRDEYYCPRPQRGGCGPHPGQSALAPTRTWPGSRSILPRAPATT